MGCDKEFSVLAILSILCIPAGVFFCFLGTLPPVLPEYLVLVGFALFTLSPILGLISYINIVRNRDRLEGGVLSILSMAFGCVYFFFWASIEASNKARTERAKKYTGEYNLRLLGRTLLKYAEDHNGYLPDPNTWCDIIMAYDADLTIDNFLFPQPEWVAVEGECHYAFNPKLYGIHIDEISDDTVIVFEADGDWNLSGNSELLSTRLNKDDPGNRISMFYRNKKIRTYWYYESAVRFITEEQGMHYRKPKWEP